VHSTGRSRIRSRKEAVLDRYAEAPDKRPVVCLEESPVQLIGQFRPGRVGSNVTIKSIVKNGTIISSFSSTCIVPDARSSTLSGGRQKTMPTACVTSSTSTIRMRDRPDCAGTPRRHVSDVSARRGRANLAADRVPLHPQAGSTWCRPKPASWDDSASLAG
jgi:hypothetical protein